MLHSAWLWSPVSIIGIYVYVFHVLRHGCRCEIRGITGRRVVRDRCPQHGRRPVSYPPVNLHGRRRP